MGVRNEELELLQVMAVACASIETMRYGQSAAEAWVGEAHDQSETMQAFAVLDHVFEERVRQDEKWGEQLHGRVEWAMILAEEIGEWAEEVINEARAEGELKAANVLADFIRAGAAARSWLENHEWPERQQSVYDVEKGS